MPSLLERVRRVRHHDNSAIPAPAPAAETHPTTPSAPPADPTVATDVIAPGPIPAVPDSVTPNPATPESEPAPDAAAPEQRSGSTPAARHIRSVPTRISGAWIAAIVAVVALVFLLIFIVQNLSPAQVHFLGANGTLPMGVAMLFAAVAGALLIALFGSARVLQLRHAARRRRP